MTEASSWATTSSTTAVPSNISLPFDPMQTFVYSRQDNNKIVEQNHYKGKQAVHALRF